MRPFLIPRLVLYLSIQSKCKSSPHSETKDVASSWWDLLLSFVTSEEKGRLNWDCQGSHSAIHESIDL